MNRQVWQITKTSLQSMAASMLSFLSGKRNTQKLQFTVFGVVIAVLLGFCIMAVLSFFFIMFFILAMFVTTSGKGQMNIYFEAVFTGTLIFSLVGSVLASQSYLFEASDNELLFSMPIKPSVILVSRISTLFILNCIYSYMVMLPALFAYAAAVGFSVKGIVFYILSLIFLPMFITAICCFAGYLIWYLASKIPGKNTFMGLIGILVFLFFMFFGAFAEPLIMYAVKNINDVENALRTYVPVSYVYAEAITSENINIELELLFIVICIVPMAAAFWFISKKLTKIITTKRVNKNKVYVEKTMKRISVVPALLKKELGFFFSIPSYVMNSGLGTVMTAVMGIVMLIKGIDAEGMFAETFTNYRAIMIMGVISALSTLCVMNDVTAPSISLEAKTLWMLKSFPVEPMKIFTAKFLVSPVITLPGILITAVCCALSMPVNALDFIFIILIPVLASVFSGMLGLLINLKLPRFDWAHEIIVIKQSGSVIISLIASAVLTAIPFIFALMLPVINPAFDVIFSYMICAVYFSAVIIICWWLLKKVGTKLFNSL